MRHDGLVVDQAHLVDTLHLRRPTYVQHVYATVKNATLPHEFSLEFSPTFDELGRLFVEPPIPVNGHMELNDKPGYGLEINEKELPGLIESI